MSPSTPLQTPAKTPSSTTPATGGAGAGAGAGAGSSSSQPPPGSAKAKRNSTISQSEITSILSACTNNFRFDGRSNLCMRPYTLLKTSTTTSASSSNGHGHGHVQDVTPILSNGSSRLFLPGSNTDIICSIKAEIVRPPLYQSKDEGLIDLNIDILPFASSSSSSNLRKEEMEVASTLMHLLIPHLVDKEQLVIVQGKYVWRLNVDVMVMQCDGNLMDVCSMAIWGAMQNTQLPNVVAVLPDSAVSKSGSSASTTPSRTKSTGKKALDEIMLDGDIAHAVVPKGVADCPIVVTVCLLPKYVPNINSNSNSSSLNNQASRNVVNAARNVSKGIENIMVVDTTRLEEACAATKVSVSVDPKGNICGVHKYGSSSILLSSTSDDSCGGTIALSTLSQVQDAAVAVSKGVFEMMKSDSVIRSAGGGTVCDFSNFFRGHFELQ